MFAIMGCNKDGNTGSSNIDSDAFSGSITAKIANADEYNTDVFKYVMAVSELSYVQGKWNCRASFVDKVPYSNDQFKITLPKTVDEGLLEDFQEIFEDGLNDLGIEIKGKLKYSVQDAKVIDADFVPFNDNVIFFAMFLYMNDLGTICQFVYANKDVTVTGNGKKIAVSLKKGWNRVYVSPDDETVTTKAPKGMKWMLVEADF